MERVGLLLLVALTACYDSHLPAGGEFPDAGMRDVGTRPDAGDAATEECPVVVTDQMRVVADYHNGNSFAPLFAAFPSGDLALAFAGRDERGPYITYQRTSSRFGALTPQVNVLTERIYVFGYPVVHTGMAYVLYGGVDLATLVSLSDDGDIVEALSVASEASEIDWLSPADGGFLVGIHSGGIRMVYIGFEGELRADVETEPATRHMSRPPIARPSGRAHVFAYVRQRDRLAILREVDNEGRLGPPAEFPGEDEWRVGLAPIGSELWLVRISESALIVDRTDASTFELIEERRFDALPNARAVATLEGRLIIVSSTPGDRQVLIDDFGTDLNTRCRTVHRLDGRSERGGFVSFVETEGAVVIGGEVDIGGPIQGWAARLALRR